MHLTVGTAFTITIFTSTVSVITHNKNKLVDFNVVKTFGVFVVLGVLAGTVIASFMKTKVLVLFFSMVVYFFGAYLMMAQEKVKKMKPNSSIKPKIILGLFVLFVPITSFMARVGANTVYKMNKLKAQRLFGVFLYVVGTIFIYRFFNI